MPLVKSQSLNEAVMPKELSYYLFQNKQKPTTQISKLSSCEPNGGLSIFFFLLHPSADCDLEEAHKQEFSGLHGAL